MILLRSKYPRSHSSRVSLSHSSTAVKSSLGFCLEKSCGDDTQNEKGIMDEAWNNSSGPNHPFPSDLDILPELHKKRHAARKPSCALEKTLGCRLKKMSKKGFNPTRCSIPRLDRIRLGLLFRGSLLLYIPLSRISQFLPWNGKSTSQDHQKPPSSLLDSVYEDLAHCKEHEAYLASPPSPPLLPQEMYLGERLVDLAAFTGRGTR